MALLLSQADADDRRSPRPRRRPPAGGRGAAGRGDAARPGARHSDAEHRRRTRSSSRGRSATSARSRPGWHDASPSRRRPSARELEPSRRAARGLRARSPAEADPGRRRRASRSPPPLRRRRSCESRRPHAASTASTASGSDVLRADPVVDRSCASGTRDHAAPCLRRRPSAAPVAAVRGSAATRCHAARHVAGLSRRATPSRGGSVRPRTGRAGTSGGSSRPRSAVPSARREALAEHVVDLGLGRAGRGRSSAARRGHGGPPPRPT